MCVVARTFEKMRSSSKPIKAEAIRKILPAICPQWDKDMEENRNRQEDAHEFLVCLINAMFHQFNDVHDVKILELHGIFDGRLEQTTRCSACEGQSQHSDVFRTLELVLSDTIDSALDKHFGRNEVESMRCESCHGENDGTIEIKIAAAPTVLCLMLKLWNEYGTKIKKIRMQIPPQLNFSRYCKEGQPKYRLKAGIVHIGDTTRNGHYTTVVCNENNRNILFNDEMVTNLSASDALKKIQRAYILLYVRDDGCDSDNDKSSNYAVAAPAADPAAHDDDADFDADFDDDFDDDFFNESAPEIPGGN